MSKILPQHQPKLFKYSPIEVKSLEYSIKRFSSYISKVKSLRLIDIEILSFSHTNECVM